MFEGKARAWHGKGGTKTKADCDGRPLARAIKGGETGVKARVAGKPDESPLYLASTRQHDDWEPMPPKEADQLKSEQLAWIKEWIAGGAPWPDEAKRNAIAKASADKWSAEDGITVKVKGALTPEWANRRYKPEALWGYQPVRKPDLETRRQGDKEIHPVDALLAVKEPAPEADARTLIRRATFDLTGLPPTPEEVAAFESDWSDV